MGFDRQTTLMAEARAKGTSNAEAMAELIHGGREALEHSYTSREDLYREGLHTGKVAWEDSVKNDHSLFDVLTPRHAMSNASPFGIHFNLFGRSIDFLGTSEQRRKWMPLVADGRINGAYVQTELGHGSNVAGIDTTAVFHPVDDTIVINTPSLSATKYWPGSVAFSTTHAVVMARLLVSSPHPTLPMIDHGIQPFLVQLRDRDTGLRTLGLELGDIGPMPGYNQNDNGFVTFTDVKIPRTGMLMGVCALDRSGKLTRLAPPEAVYGTMLSSQTFITHGAAFQLAQAIAIAIRYSVVREQGNLPFGARDDRHAEMSIMAYRSQQYRLLTQLANAYAMNFAAKITYELQADLDARLKRQDYSTVSRVHGGMAGAKAWFTTVAAEGAEDAKRCCGGHGYLSMSGLPEIVATLGACCTLEGDNVVMWQQTARYLMKVVDTIAGARPQSALPNELAYLGTEGTCVQHQALDARSLLDLRRICIIRAKHIVKSTYGTLQESVKHGMPKTEAWNTHMLLLIRAAHAHISFFVFDAFYTGIKAISEPGLSTILHQLCHLFALTQLFPQIPNSSSMTVSLPRELLIAGSETIATSEINRLLEQLVPNAIALTDAWDFSDASLASALGCADGNVCERLMAWTRQLPINVNAEKPGGFGSEDSWQKYVKPALNVILTERSQTARKGTRARL